MSRLAILLLGILGFLHVAFGIVSCTGDMRESCSMISQQFNHDSMSFMQTRPVISARNVDSVPIPTGDRLESWLAKALPSIPLLSPGHTVTPLDFVLEQGLASTSGLWLEFGVWKGDSIKDIAKHATQGKEVYGFDSFVGLPEKFAIDSSENAPQSAIAKEAFDLGGILPKVPRNVKLNKGWFNETLPGFLEKHPNEHVSLLHVDSDLYSSASFIFKMLGDRLHPGAIIVFDELVNFPDYADHEARALFEFLNDKRRAAWIGSKCPVEVKPKVVPEDVGCCATAIRLL